MTRVTFYLLASAEDSARLRFACRLARKAHGLGQRVHIHTPDAQTTQELDRLLWTFEDTAFLPHSTDVDHPDSPVTLHEAASPRERCDVLINLAGAIPGYFGRFQRIADLVGGDEAARSRGRERYRFFRERGYPLEHHEIGD
ncbi:DNA polymerase III subunit chi [Thioalkalivibrio sp.]|uniref:DNA polymerase III subunit chi n=1 Tax=Thioalkalivibrio sp. TaxID=2093813 RepID=UPI003562BBF6